MSSVDRQNNLFVAEDWKRIYQTLKHADFQSYDFENLRRTMIDYIRVNYPEDFNDYIESSEYLALIDLIAFFGQNYAFRCDLNARDNFMELSERRDSVLRLARMICYNPKRAQSAYGLMKFSTISTTETVYDSNGRNLSNQSVTWNDSSNVNWRDQFIRILNSAFSKSQQFGRPSETGMINGIPTYQYKINTIIDGVPIFSFNKTVSGRSMNFEIVSTSFADTTYLHEEPPKIGNPLSCVYRDDGRGAGSASNGFFVLFKQGTLNQGTFTVATPESNQSVDIDANNINNTDVWLYQIDQNGNESDLWTQVSTLKGNNIIYNSVSNNIRKIYTVLSRVNDQVSLQFSDGIFGDMPLGTYKLYYRVCNGLDYIITPQDIRSVSIVIPYISARGQTEELTITMNLWDTITTASSTESNESIKTNAPANFYTQNRMISPEDYSLLPSTASTQVMKIKAVNRSSIGTSRYFDLLDPTGKYSNINLFSDDGILFTEKFLSKARFTFQTQTDVEGMIYNILNPILKKENLRNFYFSNYIKPLIPVGYWQKVTSDNTSSSGLFTNVTGDPLLLGSYTQSAFMNFKAGALIRFVPPSGYYFDTNNGNALVPSTSDRVGYSSTMWATIVSVYTDGITMNNGFGPVILNTSIPNGAIVDQVIPAFYRMLDIDTQLMITNLILSSKPFGLRYDHAQTSWKIIYETNLNVSDPFSLIYAGDTSNQQRDSSWLILFLTDNEYYTITSREQRYIFESDKQIKFYYDSEKNYSGYNRDVINVLGVNTKPGTVTPMMADQKWNIIAQYMGIDGYIDTKKVVVSFIDSDNNGMVDNPETFDNIVVPFTHRAYKTTDLITGIRIINASGRLLKGLGKLTYTVSTIGSNTYGNFTWKPYGGSVFGVETVPTNVATGTRISVPSSIGSLLIEVISDLPQYPCADNIMIETTNTWIVQERYTISDSQEGYRYFDNTNQTIKIYDSENSIANLSQYADGSYFYFISTDTVKKLSLPSGILEPSLDYKVFQGRDDLKFQYAHSAEYNVRIDPGKSNIIDIYVLTKTYDTLFRQWLQGGISEKPLPPGTDELYDLIAPKLNPIKSISDEVIYHPVKYKVLFGEKASDDVKASFKVVKNPELVISDNDLKARIISEMDNFFVLENWDFGDTFYFTEMSTYIMSKLSPYVSNIVIVPVQGSLNFGSLFEIKSDSDQLFVNGASVDDIEVVAGLTPSLIKVSSNATSLVSINDQNIYSSPYGSL